MTNIVKVAGTLASKPELTETDRYKMAKVEINVPFKNREGRLDLEIHEYAVFGKTAERLLNESPGIEIELTGSMGVREYNGRKYPQVRISDYTVLKEANSSSGDLDDPGFDFSNIPF